MIHTDFANYSLKMVVLRPALVYGPGDNSGLGTMLIDLIQLDESNLLTFSISNHD